MGTSGLAVSRGCWPAAMATIIVSPMAREIARITAAETPDSAAGSTTPVAACSRVAPSANAPSRRPCGTAENASSHSDETSGRIIRPITRPGPSALKPASPGTHVRSQGVTNSSAK